MRTLPLAGKPLAAHSWPAATVAASLLRELGAEPDTRSPRAAVTLDGVEVDCPETSAEEDWAATGLAALTGRPGGPSLVPVGAPATAARALTLAIRALGGVVDDGAALLGMRRDILPLSRGGTKSANGTARLLPTRDGWLAISLARSSDFELVPALLSGEASDPWSEIAMWASRVETASAVDRATTLGLAAAGLGEQKHARPWSITPWPNTSRPTRQERPVVVNLGALWAAPLAAHVLHRSGATVVDVRTGRGEDVNDRWRDRLHDGHQTEHVDLTSPDGRNHLRELVTEADVVIEASRPRALRQLGVDAESIMPTGDLAYGCA